MTELEMLKEDIKLLNSIGSISKEVERVLLSKISNVEKKLKTPVNDDFVWIVQDSDKDILFASKNKESCIKIRQRLPSSPSYVIQVNKLEIH